MSGDSDSVLRAKAELKQAISQTPVSEPDPALSVIVPDQVLDKQRAVIRQSDLRKRSRAPSLRAQHKLLQRERWLSDDNWHAVYTAYAQTASPTAISQLTGLAVSDVQHLLSHGLKRLGLPAIRKHAVNTDEIQRIIGKYRRSTPSSDPDVQAAIEDRAAREALAAQGALDVAVETSGLVHALIARVRQTIQAGGLTNIERVTPEMIKDLANVTKASTQALKMAVELSRLSAGEPTSTVTIKLAALIAQCSPEEIAEANRTRQLPPSLRRGGIGLPSAAGDIFEAIGSSEEAEKALEAWEAMREVKGREGEDEGEGDP